jgi:hypothetical protein
MAVKVQHLRSSTASKRPTATALLDGELSINTNAGTPGVFFEDAGGTIVKIGPAEVGSSAPNATPAAGGSSGNSIGELWLDTANTGGNSQQALKIFDGTSWDYVGQITVGSTDIELGAAATTTIAGLTSLSSTGLSATSDINLENQADLRFYEATGNGSNYVGFQAPSSITANVLWTLPDADGSPGQVLITNGSGVLSWSTSGAGSTNSISQGDSSVTVIDTGSNGNISFATENATRWNINSAGHLVPQTDSTYDIGASGTEVLNVYADNLYGTLQTASQTNITGLGTVTTGTWNATAIGVAYGGTGLTATPSNGQIPIGNGTGYTLATISGGTGLTTTDGAGSITIDLDNTAVTPAAYGANDTVATFTVDQQGRLTAAAGVSISIAHGQVSDFDSGVQTNRLDQMAAPTASVSLNSQQITNLADPTSAQDAATKNYVDQVAQGLDVKASVKAATTASITLSGTQTIDTIPLIAGDRVLVKNQTAQEDNGIYVVASGSWARSADANTWDELVSAFVFVEEGSTNADNGYVCTVDQGGTLGVTAIIWEQFSGAGQITAGSGLSKTGNTLNVNVDGTTTEINGSDQVAINTAYIGQTSITTLGTITSGTWNATAIGLTYGGTGTDATNITQHYAFMGPNAAAGNASFREILTTDIAPVSGGAFDAGSF